MNPSPSKVQWSFDLLFQKEHLIKLPLKTVLNFSFLFQGNHGFRDHVDCKKDCKTMLQPTADQNHILIWTIN